MKPRYASNSDIFARRGDPWITQKEGVRDFNRNLATEDAEYDFDHRFHQTGNSFGKPKTALERLAYADERPVKRDDDPERRKASIARRMNAAIASRGRTDIEPTIRSFKPCAGCRSAVCIRDKSCHK